MARYGLALGALLAAVCCGGNTGNLCGADAGGAVAADSGAPPPQAYESAIREAQDAAFEVLRQGGTSMGFALVTKDRVVFADGFGWADLATGAKATKDTRFAIGSVSKTFAAVATMQLVEKKGVSLDDPLVKHVTGFKMADPRYDKITVGMLLDHSSGIAGTTNAGANTTAVFPDYAKSVVAALADQRLKADPGEFSVYCNDGFTLVAPLVEAVTKTVYRDYVKAEVLDKLGMARSSYSTLYPAGEFARSYQGSQGMPQEVPNVESAGGLYSTPADMAAFVRMLLDEGVAADGTKILAAESVRQMAVDRTATRFNPIPSKSQAYGLGWDSVAEPALAEVGVKGWTKNGGTFFYGTQILLAPEEGLGVVVLGPNQPGYDPTSIAQRVMLRALVEKGRISSIPSPLPPVGVAKAEPPAGLAGSMVGVYAKRNGAVQVKAKADGSLETYNLEVDANAEPLVAEFPRAPSRVLEYRTDGWFGSDAPFAIQKVSAGGRNYLAARAPAGSRTYQATQAWMQELPARTAALSVAWEARLGKAWVVVNEHPKALQFVLGADPRLRLVKVEDVTGYLSAVPPFSEGGAQVLDPAVSDQRADMLLKIPGDGSTDMNTLDVLPAGADGEWMRWGGYVLRPFENVQALVKGTTATVTIGPEAYGEWRQVAELDGVTVSQATAWVLFASGFAPLCSGDATGGCAVPKNSGPGYLLVYGPAGGKVSVDVK